MKNVVGLGLERNMTQNQIEKYTFPNKINKIDTYSANIAMKTR